jgi:hypothetical protein
VVAGGTGELIVSVGEGTQQNTVEFGFSDQAISGNRRRFGADFPRILADAGFDVHPLTSALSAEDCNKYGIAPEPFYRCVKQVTT